jgi:hypothetical protein
LVLIGGEIAGTHVVPDFVTFVSTTILAITIIGTVVATRKPIGYAVLSTSGRESFFSF